MELDKLKSKDARSIENIAFLNDLILVMQKHNKSLSHEDCEGAFIVTNYSDDNINWLLAAYEDVTKPGPLEVV